MNISAGDSCRTSRNRNRGCCDAHACPGLKKTAATERGNFSDADLLYGERSDNSSPVGSISFAGQGPGTPGRPTSVRSSRVTRRSRNFIGIPVKPGRLRSAAGHLLSINRCVRAHRLRRVYPRRVPRRRVKRLADTLSRSHA